MAEHGLDLAPIEISLKMFDEANYLRFFLSI